MLAGRSSATCSRSAPGWPTRRASVAERVEKMHDRRGRRRPPRGSGSTSSSRSCRRCGASSCPAARPPGRCAPPGAHHLPARRAPDRAPRRRRRAGRAPGLPQPAVGPAVRRRARREPPRRRRRNSNGDRRWRTRRTPRAPRSRASTTRTSRSRRGCCRAAMRPHIAAVYAFARVADDFADEGDSAAMPSGWRCSTRWRAGCTPRRPVGRDEPARPTPAAGLPPETPHIFIALGSTIRDLRPAAGAVRRPAERVPAGRHDAAATRRGTTCSTTAGGRPTRSGRLVLRIAGLSRRARSSAASDALCTALQLTNFWQDFARDWRSGRLYLPLDECRRAGAETDRPRRGPR